MFGVAEGKVKMGNLKTNKSVTLYTTDSFVVTIAASADGLGTFHKAWVQSKMATAV